MMGLDFVTAIVNRSQESALVDICSRLELPIIVSARGRGTATREILDLLGLEAQEKSVVIAIAAEPKARRLVKSARKELLLDVPGNGIIVAVPVKSVGGGRTLAFLTNSELTGETKAPGLSDYELILAILNEGYTEMVMDAARSAGVAGGTVIHAKGTGAKSAEKFFGVSLAQEKELILMVSRSAEKADIMRAVLRDAGPNSEAGTILLSLPISDIAGLRLPEDE